MRRTWTTFYSNDIDEEGRPEKHIRIPDDFLHYLDRAIDDALNEELINSGLPEEKGDRQKLFNFLASAHSAWKITWRTAMGLAATSFAAWLIYKITH